MIKKIVVFMAAFFVMLLSCAGPIMNVSASAPGYPTDIEEAYQYYNSEATYSNDYYHVWFTFDDKWYGTDCTDGFLFELNKTTSLSYSQSRKKPTST